MKINHGLPTYVYNRVKKNLAIEILLNYAYSRSSKIFNDLYESGKILGEVSFNYEYAENYAHVLIQGQSDDIEYVIIFFP